MYVQESLQNVEYEEGGVQSTYVLLLQKIYRDISVHATTYTI